jgi:hypothetical protein
MERALDAIVEVDRLTQELKDVKEVLKKAILETTTYDEIYGSLKNDKKLKLSDKDAAKYAFTTTMKLLKKELK